QVWAAHIDAGSATSSPPTTSQPPPAGFPTPQNTGWQPTGVTLQPYTGPLTISQDGTTIDSADITGMISVTADNVTITRSRIRAGGTDWAIRQLPGYSGLTLTDDEITSLAGGSPADPAIGADGTHITIERVYVHNTQRGITPGAYTSVMDSYFDDFTNNTGNHATAVGSSGGTSHVVIQHNTLGCNTGECSSALSAYPEVAFGGPHDDWLITQNLFNGGAFCVYLGYSPSDGEQPNTNIRFTNNFSGIKYHPTCGIYGPAASWSDGTGDVWTNNTWYAPGTAKDGTIVNHP